MSAPSTPRDKPESLRALVFKSPAGFLAFGFGSGLSPFAPGTIGTLVAIPFAIGLKSLDAGYFWTILTLLFLVGVCLCGHASKLTGTHDHGGIVWDEMVGYWLSIAFLPLQWTWLLAAFVLFRFFDIIKPWPIRQIERSVGGGFGIMIDDLLAAAFTIGVLAPVQYFW